MQALSRVMNGRRKSLRHTAATMAGKSPAENHALRRGNEDDAGGLPSRELKPCCLCMPFDYCDCKCHKECRDCNYEEEEEEEGE